MSLSGLPLERLVELLDDEDERVRWEATAAIVELGRAASPRLLASLHHGSPRVRYLAATALGWLKEDAAVGELIDTLADGDESVRFAAVVALTEIADPRGVGPITRLLEDPSPDVRSAAATGLARLRPGNEKPPG